MYSTKRRGGKRESDKNQYVYELSRKKEKKSGKPTVVASDEGIRILIL